MANGSEYRLNLKAVLDTSQVQQELDKLKRAQQGGGGGGGGQSSAAGGERFGANFSKLDQTLQRLNQSVQRLQRSVEQLNRGSQRAAQHVQASGAGVWTPASLAGARRGYGEKAVTQNWLQSAEYARMNASAIKEYAERYRRLGNISPFKEFYKEVGYGTHDFLDNLSRYPDYADNPGVRLYNQRRIEYNNEIQRKLDLERKRNQSMFGQNRRIAGLVAGQLLGGAADIATDLGFTKTGTVLGAVGSGISAGFGSAMAVSMMGGGNPLSIGVGAVIGLATAATQAVAGLEKLAQAAADAAEAHRKRADSLIRSGVDLER